MDPLDFTLGGLLYGDHPQLAQRCLGSILIYGAHPLVREVRLGLNAISPATRQIVREFCQAWPGPVLLYEPERNVGKYPLLRRMLYSSFGPPRPPRSSHLMWFDDDSCLVPDDGFWDRLLTRAATTPLLGKVYTRNLQGQMWAWIQAQAWAVRGLPSPPRDKLRFVTGGWWVARLRELYTWDWPWAGLHQVGGDCLLGELFRHRGWQFGDFPGGYWVNADDLGRASKAQRRGDWRDDAPLHGSDYRPGVKPSLAHQRFTYTVRDKDEFR